MLRASAPVWSCSCDSVDSDVVRRAMGLALSGADAVVVPSTRQRGCAPQREQRESLERAREGARLASRPHGPGSQRRSSGGARSSDRVGRKAWLPVPVRGTRSRLEVSHTNADKRLCDSWCPRSLRTLPSSPTQRPPAPRPDMRQPHSFCHGLSSPFSDNHVFNICSTKCRDNTSPAMCPQEENRSGRGPQHLRIPYVSRHRVTDAL